MKKTLIGLALSLAPMSVFAVGGYVEGSLGMVFVDDPKVNGSVTTVETGTISNGTLDYDDGMSFGLEVGLRDFEQHGVLRVGLAWDRFEADLDSASVTASGGTVVAPGKYSASSSELKSYGLDFDNDVDVFSVNFYYDIPTSEKFGFFLGAGLGLGDVENAKDKELAYKFAAGGRYKIAENTSVGLRWDYIAIEDIEDKLGLEYDTISVNRISANVLVNF